MRQKLCTRLEDLERITAAAAQRTDNSVSADSAIDELRAVLGAHNFHQDPNESLAETFARFRGITLRELREHLMRRAYGHSQSAYLGGL
jgi:hypothetical protein